MENRPFSPDLLKKYLANKCSEEERMILDNWYNSLNRKNGDAAYEWNEEELLAKIKTEISQKEDRNNPVFVYPAKWFWRSAQVAAVLAIALGLLWFLKPTKTETSTAQVADKGEDITYVNEQKRVVRYKLPDETVLWLNPGAKVIHPQDFSKNPSREIRFFGEAFFEVAHDSLHPFVIYSGKLKTQVLGTSFNIKAYENSTTYKISVVTGSVQVSAPEDGENMKTVILKPNQQLMYDKTANSILPEAIVPVENNYETWQPVTLSFDDIPMSEIADRLEYTFGIEIKFINPELKKCRLKVDFNNRRLPEILDMINRLLGTNYELNDNQITITGDGCAGN